MKNVKIFSVCFLCIFSSCQTFKEVYTVVTEYIQEPNAEVKKSIEVAKGIAEILSELGIRNFLNYTEKSCVIETEWQNIDTTANTVANIVLRFTNSTETQVTYVKYYITVFDDHYAIRAITRNIENTQFHQVVSNDAVDVSPGSELWRQMQLLAQKINKNLTITHYKLITRREYHEY
jgi:hypothetical protein